MPRMRQPSRLPPMRQPSAMRCPTAPPGAAGRPAAPHVPLWLAAPAWRGPCMGACSKEGPSAEDEGLLVCSRASVHGACASVHGACAAVGCMVDSPISSSLARARGCVVHIAEPNISHLLSTWLEGPLPRREGLGLKNSHTAQGASVLCGSPHGTVGCMAQPHGTAGRIAPHGIAGRQ